MASLSLIIPSYNRFYTLESNINYIDSLEVPDSMDVEFLIAANTNREKYEFITDDSRFTVHFFDEYKPIGENIYRSYKLGTKEYVYLLGDDDIIPPYFFYAIEYYLNKNFYCLHFATCHGKGEDIKNFDSIQYNSYGTFKNHYMTFKELICKYNISLGFISSVILNRNIIHTNLKLDKSLTGYEFLGPLYLNNEFQDEMACYISVPLIIERKDTNRSYNNDWPIIFLYGAYNFIIKIGDTYKIQYQNLLKEIFKPELILYNILWFNSKKRSKKERILFEMNLSKTFQLINRIFQFLPSQLILILLSLIKKIKNLFS